MFKHILKEANFNLSQGTATFPPKPNYHKPILRDIRIAVVQLKWVRICFGCWLFGTLVGIRYGCSNADETLSKETYSWSRQTVSLVAQFARFSIWVAGVAGATEKEWREYLWIHHILRHAPSSRVRHRLFATITHNIQHT